MPGSFEIQHVPVAWYHPAMARYKLTIAYDGTAFHGWQKQNRPDGSSLRTVQAVVEETVSHVIGQPVILTGASRTDTGVHAIGQVAAFTAQTPIPIERLARAVTARLPDDVQVRRAEIVRDDFDPIRDCIAKGYRYHFAHGITGEDDGTGRLRPLFDRNYVFWTYHDLDVDRMNEAARHLIGEHDFASFAKVNHGRESTVRTIYDCAVTASGAHRCHIDVSGNGFLYHMVRIIAGTLMEIGRGAVEPDAMPSIIAAADRRAAGPTLPPTGLCLRWIRYGDDGAQVPGTDAGEDNAGRTPPTDASVNPT